MEAAGPGCLHWSLHIRLASTSSLLAVNITTAAVKLQWLHPVQYYYCPHTATTAEQLNYISGDWHPKTALLHPMSTHMGTPIVLKLLMENFLPTIPSCYALCSFAQESRSATTSWLLALPCMYVYSLGGTCTDRRYREMNDTKCLAKRDTISYSMHRQAKYAP